MKTLIQGCADRHLGQRHLAAQGKSNHCDLIQPLLLGFSFSGGRDVPILAVNGQVALPPPWREVSGPPKGSLRKATPTYASLRQRVWPPPGEGVAALYWQRCQGCSREDALASGCYPPSRTVAHHCQPFPRKKIIPKMHPDFVVFSCVHLENPCLSVPIRG